MGPRRAGGRGRATVGRTRELAALRRHLDAGGQAIVLCGPAGVGKSHLVRVLLDLEADRGRDVVTAVAGPALAAVPFAVVAELVPPDATGGDPLTVLHRSRAYVASRAARQPMTIAVEDAHLLDPGSLALVRGLVDLPDVRVVCTVRTGEPVPAEVDELWKDRGGLRLDLAPLRRREADELAATILGGRPDDPTAATLWTLARGNPLYLRELLLGARDHGQLAQQDGRWRLTEPPTVTSRLVDVVSRRLEGLDASARTGLDALAVAEPLGHAELVELAGTRAVAGLESAGLVSVQPTGRHPEVRFAHPIHGEVVRATLPHARRVEVADALLDVLPDDVDRPADRLRVAALWRLAGRPGRPELFVAAAREALAVADLVGARDHAASAVERGGGTEALLASAEALVYLGGGPAADAALTAAAEDATTDAEVARAALLRFHDHAFNRGELAHAITLVADALDQVSTPEWRDRLATAVALGSMLRADLAGALDAVGEVLAREDAEPPTLLGALVISSLVHVLAGDVGSAMQDLDRARPLVGTLRDTVPLAGDQLGITEVLARWHDARVDAAVELARDRDAAARDAAGDPSGTWGTAVAVVLIETGQLEEAASVAAQAAAALEVADPLGLRPTALALAARAAAGLGEVTTAGALVDSLEGSARLDVRGTIFLGRARSWLLAAQGELAAATTSAREAGEAAIANGHVVWGATLLHDAVRFGSPGEVVALLRTAAGQHGCALLLLLAQHADALVAGDADALRRVARAFEAGGFTLYAAEAMAQAAEVAARAGAAGRAAAAATAAGELVRRCGAGVTTPALVQAAEPLTPREREVALLAGAGATSREVAERLGVSVRTVDNHLASVYRKAGIGGRHELGELFADPSAGQR